MIQDIGPKKYHNEYYDKLPDESGQILIYRGSEVLLRKEEDGYITFPVRTTDI